MLSALRFRVPAARLFSTSPITRTAAGYGDPQDEKIANKTPTPKPSSQPEPYQGKSTGTTDPEVAGDKQVTEKEIKETKKIGKKPEKEEVGGAGVIGG